MTVVLTACGGVLAAAALLLVARLWRGPSLADRVLTLDALLVVTGSGIALVVAATRSADFLNDLVVVALLSFVGTVAVARFIEDRD